MESKIFWGLVTKKQSELEQAHQARIRKFRESGDRAALQGQPEDGRSIFVVSRENPERMTTAGSVHEAVIRLAAQRIVEQTHEVATPEQIAGWFKLQEENAATIAAMNAKLEGRRTVNVQPLQPTTPARVTRGN